MRRRRPAIDLLLTPVAGRLPAVEVLLAGIQRLLALVGAGELRLQFAALALQLPLLLSDRLNHRAQQRIHAAFQFAKPLLALFELLAGAAALVLDALGQARVPIVGCGRLVKRFVHGSARLDAPAVCAAGAGDNEERANTRWRVAGSSIL
jgi:hypothetical protein